MRKQRSRKEKGSVEGDAMSKWLSWGWNQPPLTFSYVVFPPYHLGVP